MKFDLYWSDALYNTVARTANINNLAKAYIAKTNTLKYIDKTFDDTLSEEAGSIWTAREDPIAAMKANEELTTLEEESVSREVIDFWGAGFDVLFYQDLEKRYEEWTGGAEITDPTARALYKQICMLEVTISRDTAQGKTSANNINALNNLLGSMNLKPSQKTDDVDADLENMPLGVGIQKWEFDRPLPATKENLKDKNHRIRDITTWFLGHAGKMVGLKNSYVSMYESAMEELRVKRPEYADEDDDTVLTDLFGGTAVAAAEGDADGEE